MDENEAVGRRYDRVVRLVAETPWAVLPGTLARIVAILHERRTAGRPSAEEIAERIRPASIEAFERRAVVEPPPSVAVIPIEGVIMPKADLVSELSGGGGASLEAFGQAFAAAVTDPAISSIVLNIDSPGGVVDGVPETADLVRGARGAKPIIAVANAWAASAAYWIASAADQLVVTPSGQVGSIGVYAAHEDLSAANEIAGVKTTLVSAGEHKTEANPFEPLSEEARAEMQRKVDHYFQMFVSAVAAGRDVTEKTVIEDFGGGRMMLPDQAVEVGAADRVATLDQVVSELAGAVAETRSVTLTGRRPSIPHEAPAFLRRRVEAPEESRSWSWSARSLPPIELRSVGESSIEIFGYAATFEDWYPVVDPWGSFEELVERGAFDQTLAGGADVRLMLADHRGLPLARTKSGTLQLGTDEIGLWYSSKLAAEDPDVQRLVPKIQRGDMTDSSFTFKAIRQKWEADYTRRRLIEVELRDVTPAVFGANTGTSLQVAISTLADADPEELAVAARSVEDELDVAALERVQELVSSLLTGRRDTAGKMDPAAALALAEAYRDRRA